MEKQQPRPPHQRQGILTARAICTQKPALGQDHGFQDHYACRQAQLYARPQSHGREHLGAHLAPQLFIVHVIAHEHPKHTHGRARA